MGEMGFGHLLFLGDQREHYASGAKAGGMDGRSVHTAGTYEEVLERLEELMEKGDWILVKGSRKMRMEKIVEGLIERRGRA